MNKNYSDCTAPKEHDSKCRCGRGAFVLWPGGCRFCGTAAHTTDLHPTSSNSGEAKGAEGE